MVRHTETEVTAMKAEVFIMLAVPGSRRQSRPCGAAQGSSGVSQEAEGAGETGNKSPVRVSLEKARQDELVG